jgi:uncharacterized membrane protein YcaP (DUF421 family)
MGSSADLWREIFVPTTSPLELFVRGSALYLAILLLIRIMPRRTGGELALMDLLFVVLVADAGAHALGAYQSITDAVFMIVVLMGWNYLLNLLSYRFAFVERLVSPPPLQIVRDGELLLRNMRRELITKDELMDQLRQHGVDSLDKVKAAYVEPEGKLTVICR